MLRRFHSSCSHTIARSPCFTRVVSPTSWAVGVRYASVSEASGKANSIMKKLMPAGMREFLLIVPVTILSFWAIWNLDTLVPSYVALNPDLRDKLTHIKSGGDNTLDLDELRSMPSTIDHSSNAQKTRTQNFEDLSSYRMEEVRDAKGRIVAYRKRRTTEPEPSERPDLAYEATKAQ